MIKKKFFTIFCLIIVIIVPSVINSNNFDIISEEVPNFSLNELMTIDSNWFDPILLTTDDVGDFDVIKRSNGEINLFFKRDFDGYWYSSSVVNNELTDISLQDLPQYSTSFDMEEYNNSVYANFNTYLFRRVNNINWEFWSFGTNSSVRDLDINSSGNFNILQNAYSSGTIIYFWFSENGLDWDINNRSMIYTSPYSLPSKFLEKNNKFYVIFRERYDFKIIESNDGETWSSLNTIFNFTSYSNNIFDFDKFENGTAYLLYQAYLPGNYNPVFLTTSNDPDLLTWNEPIQLTPNEIAVSDAKLIENPDKTLSLFYRANTFDLYVITTATSLSIDILSKTNFIDINENFYLNLDVVDNYSAPVFNSLVSLDLYFPNNTYFLTITNSTDFAGQTSISFNLTGFDPGKWSFFLTASKPFLGSFSSKRYFFNYLIRDVEFPYLMFLNNISYSNVTQELIVDLNIQNFDINDFHGYLYFTLFTPNNIPLRTEYYAISVNNSSILNFNKTLFHFKELGNYYGQIVLRNDTAENFGIPILFKEFNISI